MHLEVVCLWGVGLLSKHHQNSWHLGIRKKKSSPANLPGILLPIHQELPIGWKEGSTYFLYWSQSNTWSGSKTPRAESNHYKILAVAENRTWRKRKRNIHFGRWWWAEDALWYSSYWKIVVTTSIDELISLLRDNRRAPKQLSDNRRDPNCWIPC